MNSTRPGRSAWRALSSRAAPTSIDVWVSWPQACICPSTLEAKSSPVSSGIGSASMSPRSSTVGPGLPPSSIAAMPLVVSCSVMSSGRPSSAASTASRVCGQVVADLRPRVQLAAQLDHAGEQVAGSSRTVSRSVSVCQPCAPMLGTLPWDDPERAGRHRRRRRPGDRHRARARDARRATCSTARSASPCSARDGRLLVHRRADDKDVWPGRWDLAVGGVVAAGEDYDTAAVREVAEEIGVTRRRAAAHRQRALRRRRCRLDRPLLRDRPRRSVRFDDGEVVEVRWVDRTGSTS